MDARRKLRWIGDRLEPQSRVLEAGSGPGSLLEALRAAGREVTAVNIEDSSYAPELAPLIFDGKTLPFPSNSFVAALLATTLHHATDPDRLIAETARVAPSVTVIEDIDKSELQRKLTFFADSLTNLPFGGHPHANRDDAGWRSAFAAAGLTLVGSETKPFAGIFLQALYELRR